MGGFTQQAHHLANARGMAKLNAVLMNGGIVDGVRLLSQEGADRAFAECAACGNFDIIDSPLTHHWLIIGIHFGTILGQ